MPEKIESQGDDNKHCPTNEQSKICENDLLNYQGACYFQFSSTPIGRYDFNRGWEYGFGSCIEEMEKKFK